LWLSKQNCFTCKFLPPLIFPISDCNLVSLEAKSPLTAYSYFSRSNVSAVVLHNETRNCSKRILRNSISCESSETYLYDLTTFKPCVYQNCCNQLIGGSSEHLRNVTFTGLLQTSSCSHITMSQKYSMGLRRTLMRDFPRIQMGEITSRGQH
jgi:hypothetical protein